MILYWQNNYISRQRSEEIIYSKSVSIQSKYFILIIDISIVFFVNLLDKGSNNELPNIEANYIHSKINNFFLMIWGIFLKL